MEQFLEVARVALGTVVDEYLVKAEAYTTGCEVVLQDGFAEELITLLWAVASEPIHRAHLVDGLVHGLDDGRTERLGDITDT